MARTTNRLTARGVASLKTIGRHSDGDRLYLAITRTAAGTLSRRWVFMYSLDGKQREAGLGSASAVTLAKARAKAAEYRNLLGKGVDPLGVAKAVTAAKKTFGECATVLFESKKSEWRSPKHAGQWLGTLTEYCRPLWNRPVDSIDTALVLSVLQPVWQRIPETASRLRGRIEAVLDAARAKGHIAPNEANPARWKGHLAMLLAKRTKFSRSHHAAMAYSDVPAFIATLRENAKPGAALLEFCILTAARSGEAFGARWDEIDTDAKVWTIPAARMKAGQEHRVPLSSRTLEILQRQAAVRRDDLVFPGHRIGKPLSLASLRLLRPPGATPHGFRSSFRDWVSEETSFAREIAEQALAHATGGAVELAYRRGDALEKRRALMQAWAQFCEPGAAGNVVPIRVAQ
jgi:integrase